MIKTIVNTVKFTLNLSLYRSFSRDYTPVQKMSQEEIDLIHWRIHELSRKNVMRNYDTILPGLFLRND